MSNCYFCKLSRGQVTQQTLGPFAIVMFSPEFHFSVQDIHILPGPVLGGQVTSILAADLVVRKFCNDGQFGLKGSLGWHLRVNLDEKVTHHLKAVGILETGPETPILHKRPFLWHRLSIP